MAEQALMLTFVVIAGAGLWTLLMLATEENHNKRNQRTNKKR